MAQDDTTVPTQTRAFYDALFKAGYKPELHFFLNGGHGFGMNPSRNTSRHFIDEFYWWMESLGLTRKPGDPDMAAPVRGAGRGGAPGGAPGAAGGGRGGAPGGAAPSAAARPGG
jgi:hypothetical protein